MRSAVVTSLQGFFHRINNNSESTPGIRFWFIDKSDISDVGDLHNCMSEEEYDGADKSDSCYLYTAISVRTRRRWFRNRRWFDRITRDSWSSFFKISFFARPMSSCILLTLTKCSLHMYAICLVFVKQTRPSRPQFFSKMVGENSWTEISLFKLLLPLHLYTIQRVTICHNDYINYITSN